MVAKINSILKEVLIKVKPSEEEMKNMTDLLKRIKKLNFNVEIFVGGSYAKKTMIRKGKYDIDVFLRFDKKYNDEDISSMLNRLLNDKDILLIHGSRDYYRKKISSNIYIELVPVRKIKNPKEAVNVTDLSFLHVKYIGNKIKNKNILDEIRLAKAFCFANNCYGAESYVHGFSGYAIELLVYHYKRFIKFLKAMSKIHGKTIIDIEKHYKNKSLVMMDLNSAKLNSPIILIDPTYKQRNALAGLSQETFDKFKEECKKFLKNPKMESFELKEIDLEKLKETSRKNKQDFVMLRAITDKQAGDIAGSKLFKFFRFLDKEISKSFKVSRKEFLYGKEKTAEYYFVAKNKGEFIANGPNVKDYENVKRFKAKHKNTFIKKNRIFAKEKIKENLADFLENWVKKNRNIISEMGITKLEFKD
jgi:tRNA CCA-adding enzyme